VRREEPLQQQLSAVSALLVAATACGDMQNGKRIWKTEIGAEQGFFKIQIS
jgi:hypothetical protein